MDKNEAARAVEPLDPEHPLDKLFGCVGQYQTAVRELFSMEHKPALHMRSVLDDQQAYRAFLNLNNTGRALTKAMNAVMRAAPTPLDGMAERHAEICAAYDRGHADATAALRAQAEKTEAVAWGVVYRGNGHDWTASRPAYPDKSEYHAEQLRKHGYEALVVYTTPPPVASEQRAEGQTKPGILDFIAISGPAFREGVIKGYSMAAKKARAGGCEIEPLPAPFSGPAALRAQAEKTEAVMLGCTDGPVRCPKCGAGFIVRIHATPPPVASDPFAPDEGPTASMVGLTKASEQKAGTASGFPNREQSSGGGRYAPASAEQSEGVGHLLHCNYQHGPIGAPGCVCTEEARQRTALSRPTVSVGVGELPAKWRRQDEPNDLVRDAVQQCADELEVALSRPQAVTAGMLERGVAAYKQTGPWHSDEARVNAALTAAIREGVE